MAHQSDWDLKDLESQPFTNSKSRKHTSKRNTSVSDSENEASFDSEDDEYTYSLKKSSSKKAPSNLCFKLLVVIFIIIILGLIAGIVWQHFHLKSELECMTENCVKTSSLIMTKMNRSVDPCVDFYEYACGGWEKSAFIPPDKGKYGAFAEATKKNDATLQKVLDEKGHVFKGKNSTAIKKAKMYYQACMNKTEVKKQGLTPILQYIKKLGSWTVTSDTVSGTWNAASWDFIEALVRIHQQNKMPFFKLKVAPDDKNNSNNILKFEQDGLTLIDHQEYLGNNSEKFHKAFIKFGTKFGMLLGGNESVVRSKMSDIYEFEKKLAEVYVSKADLQDPLKYYNKMSVEEFQKLLGGKDVFDLKRYLDKIFNDDVLLTEEVIITSLDYFKKLGGIIKNATSEVINNYLVWSVIQYTAGYLPDEFVDAALILTKAESGTSAVAPRWQRCVYKTNSALGFATSALFVEERFTPGTREKVSEILDEIKHAFLMNLHTVTWMDGKTQEKAIEKGEAVEKMIGYPDFIMDPVKLDDHYVNLTIPDGQFLQSYINACVWGFKKQLEKHGKPPDRKKWGMMPSEVNAYYSISWNYIVVPAGILQQPFFEPTFPQFVNFGALGFALSHEITHGFDETGKDYDKYGNMKNWWSKASADSFSEKAKCLENQYSHYEVDGVKLNGLQTLGENIADNGGLKAAFTAYKMNNHAQMEKKLPAIGLTNDQVFFVSFAQVWCSYYRPAYAKQSVLVDPHSIAEFRVKGTISNSAEFSSAYKCPMDSPMNPKKKCHIW
ncbi:endothelin-converting enzyme 2-like isoform X1 [Gigantopelta aegis]|uniref:endothelin-converting enzyme 2-like isoform X1 n=2 Tax=Gigantopelta aegis TaxID=1735272 RepID=UPI001B88E707|nr:endothelin-converting enzyme 2-like isoform X1 [Gigantopelta aegis]